MLEHAIIVMLVALLLACKSSAARPQTPAGLADVVHALPGWGALENGPVRMYSGLLPLTASMSAFYAVVEAEEEEGEGHLPLILFMNGGPGCSSIGGGMFGEIGPLRPSSACTPGSGVSGCLGGTGPVRLLLNEHRWSRFAHLVFADLPVGTGWSVACDDADYDADDEGTADQVLLLLRALLIRHPWLQGAPLYLAGESYAGHYIPHAALKLQQAARPQPQLQPQPQPHALPPLAGLLLINPWTAPEHDEQGVAEYAYHHGLISSAAHQSLLASCSAVGRARDPEAYLEAADRCDAESNHLLNQLDDLDLFNILGGFCYRPPPSIMAHPPGPAPQPAAGQPTQAAASTQAAQATRAAVTVAGLPIQAETRALSDQASRGGAGLPVGSGHQAPRLSPAGGLNRSATGQQGPGLPLPHATVRAMEANRREGGKRAGRQGFPPHSVALGQGQEQGQGEGQGQRPPARPPRTHPPGFLSLPRQGPSSASHLLAVRAARLAQRLRSSGGRGWPSLSMGASSSQQGGMQGGRGGGQREVAGEGEVWQGVAAGGGRGSAGDSWRRLRAEGGLRGPRRQASPPDPCLEQDRAWYLNQQSVQAALHANQSTFSPGQHSSSSSSSSSSSNNGSRSKSIRDSTSSPGSAACPDHSQPLPLPGPWSSCTNRLWYWDDDILANMLPAWQQLLLNAATSAAQDKGQGQGQGQGQHSDQSRPDQVGQSGQSGQAGGSGGSAGIACAHPEWRPGCCRPPHLATVRGAGHMVPYYRPAEAYWIAHAFLRCGSSQASSAAAAGSAAARWGEVERLC
ncbi:Alpha/Beta hydrolase protein [Haematococcus lacustris]